MISNWSQYYQGDLSIVKVYLDFLNLKTREEIFNLKTNRLRCLEVAAISRIPKTRLWDENNQMPQIVNLTQEYHRVKIF